MDLIKVNISSRFIPAECLLRWAQNEPTQNYQVSVLGHTILQPAQKDTFDVILFKYFNKVKGLKLD